MTEEAMKYLFDWAHKNKKSAQKSFALFYDEYHGAYANDEAFGGKGVVTVDVAKRMIEDFERK